MRFSKTFFLIVALILISSCSARMNYIIGEGFLFIICILALILGVGFINGLITQKGDSSSESKRITKDFGCMGTILIISVIIVLLYQCS